MGYFNHDACVSDFEAHLDAQSAMDPLEARGLYPGEHPCRSCGKFTGQQFLDESGLCDRAECLEDRHS